MNVRRKLAVLVVAVLGFGAQCFNAKTVNSALDVYETACILFHDKVEDSKELATICAIPDYKISDLIRLLQARRQAAAKKAAMAAPSTSASAP